jgi:alkyl sulfatase BDS1-like metallo-beta-lactamase superfamily hydrolase
MKKKAVLILVAMILFTLSACGTQSETDMVAELGLNAEIKDATQHTVEVNSALYSKLDFEDTSEYENATKGLIAAPETLELKDADGNIVWSQKAYSFVDNYEKAPDTVNPSLWENTKNNHAYGLFEVVDGIYQVRGYDMANLTVVEGETGWIVFDPLMGVECSAAAMQLVNDNLGERPIKAVIISHSHVDHYGGIAGVISSEETAEKNI